MVVLCALVGTPATADEASVLVFETASEDLHLSAADVARAAPLFGDQGPGLSFDLAPDAMKDFADFTERSIGEVLSMSICGDVVVSAVIQARIEGRGQVGLESLGAATHYAAVLNGEISC